MALTHEHAISPALPWSGPWHPGSSVLPDGELGALRPIQGGGSRLLVLGPLGHPMEITVLLLGTGSHTVAQNHSTAGRRALHGSCPLPQWDGSPRHYNSIGHPKFHPGAPTTKHFSICIMTNIIMRQTDLLVLRCNFKPQTAKKKPVIFAGTPMLTGWLTGSLFEQTGPYPVLLWVSEHFRSRRLGPRTPRDPLSWGLRHWTECVRLERSEPGNCSCH